LNRINEDFIEKEINAFPQFEIEQDQKEKMLQEIFSNQVNRSDRYQGVLSKYKYVMALAATFLISLTLVFGWVNNRNAEQLFGETKILTDIDVSIQKLRNLSIPYIYDKSNLDTDIKVKDYLSKYYGNPALNEVFLTWKQLREQDGDITEEEIENTKLNIIFTTNPQNADFLIEKTSVNTVSVTWKDEMTGATKKVVCKLEGERWLISEIKQ
jgi:hypothetical protein